MELPTWPPPESVLVAANAGAVRQIAKTQEDVANKV